MRQTLSHEIGIKGKVTSFEIPTHGLNLACFVFEVILFGLFWLVELLGKIKILVLKHFFRSNSDLMGPNRHF